MAEFSRDAFPPGGWQFRQPQTGWATSNIGLTFNQVVQEIIKHRRANMAIVTKYKLAVDPVSVGNELETFNRVRTGAPAPPKMTPPRSFAASLGAVAAAAGGEAANLIRAAQGTAVLMDWLSSGGDPVAPELSAKRAAICVACPKNQPGSWYTVAPAQIIKATLEKWKTLRQEKGQPVFELKTPSDEALKSCDVCKCLMPLKVHVPLSNILEKTKANIMAEFPQFCWIARKDQ